MRTTVSLPDDLAAYVDERFARDDGSDAQAIRDAVRHARQHDERVEELEAAVDDLEAELEDVRAERDDLRRQLAAANRRIDSANEIVEHVRERRSVEQQYREAGVLTRAKWWLTGMDADDEAAEG